MKKITKKQKETLLLFASPPMGKGLTEKEIAKKLGISKRAVIYRLMSFKSKHPEAYKHLWDSKKLHTKNRHRIENPLSLEGIGGCNDIAVGESITHDGKGEKIIDKF